MELWKSSASCLSRELFFRFISFDNRVVPNIMKDVFQISFTNETRFKGRRVIRNRVFRSWLWNAIPNEIKECNFIVEVKRRIKRWNQNSIVKSTEIIYTNSVTCTMTQLFIVFISLVLTYVISLFGPPDMPYEFTVVRTSTRLYVCMSITSYLLLLSICSKSRKKKMWQKWISLKKYYLP